MSGGKQKTPVFTRLRPHHRTPNLIGERYGRLVVTEYVGGDGRKSWWRVRCDCGVEKLAVGAELRKGKTQSCGCYMIEVTSARARTHGMSKHQAYWCWRSMVDRCGVPANQAYKNYGERGIKVCSRWLKFENFWADTGASWKSGLSLERKNNDLGYSPENCTWADRIAQSRNRRSNRYIDTPKGRMLFCEAVKISGLSHGCIQGRIKTGWPVKFLFDPPGSKKGLSEWFTILSTPDPVEDSLFG